MVQLLLREKRLFGLQLVAASKGRLKRGTVYVTLGRMEEKGYITSTLEDPPPGAGRLAAPALRTNGARPPHVADVDQRGHPRDPGVRAMSGIDWLRARAARWCGPRTMEREDRAGACRRADRVRGRGARRPNLVKPLDSDRRSRRISEGSGMGRRGTRAGRSARGDRFLSLCAGLQVRRAPGHCARHGPPHPATPTSPSGRDLRALSGLEAANVAFVGAIGDALDQLPCPRSRSGGVRSA